jgi:hypothetical protein
VDTSSKSPIFNVGDEDEGEKDGKLQVPLSSSFRNGTKEVQVEHALSNNRRYPERARKPPGEWWKNHIFPPSDDKHAYVTLSDGPSTIREAMQGEDAVKWEQAMPEEYEEYESLITNGTWELTPISKGRNSIRCKRVNCAKTDVCGDIVRYKVGLVAKVMDFHKSFALVAKFTTI